MAIIVGPVGSLTAYYRSDAEKAAAEARRYTDDVVTVYSPDATWSAARAAMAGASLVVYLGHGNGWPSRYSSRLNPRTQDGLGLNPVAGKGDLAHQYFGEAYLAERVELAPNAVVVLSHLCYASGNSEPGLPEGTLEVAKQRVDNFAAGFLAAGASAVIADGYLGPAYYVRSILAGRGTVEGIWRAAPNFHGHVLAFPSTRTPGFGALMDPTARRSGFYRSLVTRADLRAGEVAAGRSGRSVGTTGEAGPPTPPPGGWQVVLPPEPTGRPRRLRPRREPGTPALAGMALAAATVGLTVPVEVPAGVTLGTAYRLGTRWIPLDEATASAAEPAGRPGSTRTAIPPRAADPAASPGPRPARQPAATPAGRRPRGQPRPSASPTRPSTRPRPPTRAPASTRGGTRRRPGGVRTRGPRRPRIGGLARRRRPRHGRHGRPGSATVGLPPVSGRYRLEVTLHDADGVALPYAVQASIPGLVVRVGGPGAAWLDAPPALSLVPGTLASLQVLATNGEATAWGACATAPDGPGPGTGPGPGIPPARPSASSGAGWPSPAAPRPTPMTRELAIPAASAQATWLSGPVPTEPGTYLLLLSLERAGGGDPPQVLGRPVTVTVVVAATPPAAGGRRAGGRARRSAAAGAGRSAAGTRRRGGTGRPAPGARRSTSPGAGRRRARPRRPPRRCCRLRAEPCRGAGLPDRGARSTPTDQLRTGSAAAASQRRRPPLAGAWRRRPDAGPHRPAAPVPAAPIGPALVDLLLPAADPCRAVAGADRAFEPAASVAVARRVGSAGRGARCGPGP